MTPTVPLVGSPVRLFESVSVGLLYGHAAWIVARVVLPLTAVTVVPAGTFALPDTAIPSAHSIPLLSLIVIVLPVAPPGAAVTVNVAGEAQPGSAECGPWKKYAILFFAKIPPPGLLSFWQYTAAVYE